MRFTIAIPLLYLFAPCGEINQLNEIDKYIVETTVQLQTGESNKVLELSKTTNSALVSGESDWISASFSIIEGQDIAIVCAEWKSKQSYSRFSNADKLKETMRQFQYFTVKPTVTISKVLLEM